NPVSFVPGSISNVTCIGGFVDGGPGVGDGRLFDAPGAGLLLAANLGPSFCSADFKVQINSMSGDSTPFVIEQLVGYHVAKCDGDNKLLDSGNFQTASIELAGESRSFNCYEIPRRTSGKPPVCANCTPHLIDPFTAPAGVTLPVGRPHRLCAPADLTSEPNQTPANKQGDHLEGYDYIGTIQPSFSPKKIEVTNMLRKVPAKLE